MTKGLFVLTLSSVLGVCMGAGCSERAHVLTMVFPDGFRGAVVLRAKQPGGVDLNLGAPEIILNFSDSGILRVKGELPTLKWHRLTGKFVSGESIPVPGPDREVPDDVIALRSVGILGDDEDWYVVGALEDVGKTRNRIHGIPEELK